MVEAAAESVVVAAVAVARVVVVTSKNGGRDCDVFVIVLAVSVVAMMVAGG